MQEAGLIIKISDYRDRKYKPAYDWAVEQQKKYGFIASPIRFEFGDRDELTYDQNSVYLSIFFDCNTGRAIMRRDWDDGFTVKYNALTNFREIRMIAPKSLEKLLENGVALYERYKRAGLSL